MLYYLNDTDFLSQDERRKCMLSRLSTCYRLTRPCTRLALTFRRNQSAPAHKAAQPAELVIPRGSDEARQPTELESASISFNNVVRRLQSLGFAAGQQLSLPTELEQEQWRSATDAKYVQEAIEQEGERLHDAPTWVTMYLIGCKVHSPQDAMAAVNLMLRSFHRADSEQKIAMILLAIRFLAQQNVALPIPKLVKLFLVLRTDEPELQFNLLLHSMSHFRQSEPVAKAAADVLRAMHARQIHLQARTYTILLSHSLINLELAKTLEAHMVQDDFQPDLEQLARYLQVFARSGAVHSAARYLNLIKVLRERRGQRGPHGLLVVGDEDDADLIPSRSNSVHRSVASGHTTRILRSLKNSPHAAFNYLRQMIKYEEETKAMFPTPKPRKETRLRLGRKFRRHGPRTIKSGDWLAVLNALSRNNHIGSEKFFETFDETQRITKFPMNLVAFTVVMRGLAKKGDYATAEAVWRRCMERWERRRNLDAPALTVAMDVLVGANKGIEAFETLILATGVMDQAEVIGVLRRVKTHHQHKNRNMRSRRANIDHIVVNALMFSFLKHGRPEMVFKLWDAFHPLFGVHPDAESLMALLMAAEKVARFDNTFRGVLEHLGLHKLFNRSGQSLISFSDRKKHEIVESLRRSIGMQRIGIPNQDLNDTLRLNYPSNNNIVDVAHSDASDGNEDVRDVRKSVWANELAAPKALQIFREILLGNHPELKDVKAPARAVWSDESLSANPMRDAARMLGILWVGGKDESEEDQPNRYYGQMPTLTERERHAPKLFGPSSALFSILYSPASSTSGSQSGEITKPERDEEAERAFFTSLQTPYSPFPQINPTRQLFAAYISLLGTLSRSSEIAQALAWQRHLSIRPLKRELADAMALWAEAAMRGPLFEYLGRDDGAGRERSEFERLRRWCEDWVGERHMVGEADIIEAFGRLKVKRERRSDRN